MEAKGNVEAAMSETKMRIEPLGQMTTHVWVDDGNAATFSGPNHESLARSFVAGERAIEALKEIKAEIESLFNSDITMAQDDTVLQGLLETCNSALPAEETK